MLELSIVVCTYERPQRLARTLDAVLACEGLADAAVELIVVDNAQTESARAVVTAAGARAPIPVRFVAARPANIAVARNAGSAAARGRFVAFLDDDQEVAPAWLGVILRAAQTHPHDVFFAAVRPRFDDEATATPAARAMFSRLFDAPTGTPLSARRRIQPFVLGTGNSVFRRATALADPAPFDPAFGDCGGEDFHLFLKLERAGARFAWIAGAEASEAVPAHRCSPDYLALRHYAGGQAYAAALIDTSPAPRLAALSIALRARVQEAVLTLRARIAPGDEAARAERSLRLAGVRGKRCWKSLHPLYREEARGSAAGGAGDAAAAIG